MTRVSIEFDVKMLNEVLAAAACLRILQDRNVKYLYRVKDEKEVKTDNASDK